MLSRARGSIRTVSSDPGSRPEIRFNYLSSDQDRGEWVAAIGAARRILNQPAMAPFNAGELAPGPEVTTAEQVLAWVAGAAETALHPCGSCALGTTKLSVVEPASMRVHGLDGVRVVDASVLPIIPNGNIYAPTMMVAEKAADLILGNHPLPPMRTNFYRHDGSGATDR